MAAGLVSGSGSVRLRRMKVFGPISLHPRTTPDIIGGSKTEKSKEQAFRAGRSEAEGSRCHTKSDGNSSAAQSGLSTAVTSRKPMNGMAMRQEPSTSSCGYIPRCNTVLRRGIGSHVGHRMLILQCGYGSSDTIILKPAHLNSPHYLLRPLALPHALEATSLETIAHGCVTEACIRKNILQ
jgi:hypothetical protein